MARFKKAIVTAGTYSLPDGKGGMRREHITPDRLAYWANTAEEMRKKGARIPAPWKHDRDAQPVFTGSDGTLSTSYDNGGFWRKVWVDYNKKGVPTLFGELDVPGNSKDPDSPAYKVGRTVKETSIYVRPEFKDGKDNVWRDSIMHVALVTHPVESGQDDFESVESTDALALSMSQIVEMDMGSSVQDLLRNLNKVAKIRLPDDTNTENLVERLNAALLQKERSEEGEDDAGSTKKPPREGRGQPTPISMSFNQKQIDSILLAKIDNPDTGKLFTKEELEVAGTQMSTPPAPAAPEIPPEVLQQHPAIQQAIQMATTATTALKIAAVSNYQNRIKKLVDRGLPREQAEARFESLLNNFQMSFGEDGQPVRQAIDEVLDIVEMSLPAATPVTSVTGSMGVHNVPGSVDSLLQTLGMAQGIEQTPPIEGDGNGSMSAEQTQDVVKAFLSNTSF